MTHTHASALVLHGPRAATWPKPDRHETDRNLRDQIAVAAYIVMLAASMIFLAAVFAAAWLA